jgi:hypothetical protein
MPKIDLNTKDAAAYLDMVERILLLATDDMPDEVRDLIVDTITDESWQRSVVVEAGDKTIAFLNAIVDLFDRKTKLAAVECKNHDFDIDFDVDPEGNTMACANCGHEVPADD